jgi:hypothetical protein
MNLPFLASKGILARTNPCILQYNWCITWYKCNNILFYCYYISMLLFDAVHVLWRVFDANWTCTDRPALERLTYRHHSNIYWVRQAASRENIKILKKIEFRILCRRSKSLCT